MIDMQHSLLRPGRDGVVLSVLLAALALATPVWAFPPAPHHEIFGTIRGEDGEPLQQPSATIIFQAITGSRLTTQVNPKSNPGENYRLVVPMDSGVAPDLVEKDLLVPLLPFRIVVLVGGVTNLPIEMTSGFRSLGEIGEETRIDMTLGVDSDGDGLPDAWERLVIEQMGTGLTLADVGPDDDTDGDGMRNLAEYIAGTFAFDPTDGFDLMFKERTDTSVRLEFLAIGGRSYHIRCSEDMQTWVDVDFSVPADGLGLRSAYSASSVVPLVIEIPSTNPASFYRGFVQ